MLKKSRCATTFNERSYKVVPWKRCSGVERKNAYKVVEKSPLETSRKTASLTCLPFLSFYEILVFRSSWTRNNTVLVDLRARSQWSITMDARANYRAATKEGFCTKRSGRISCVRLLISSRKRITNDTRWYLLDFCSISRSACYFVPDFSYFGSF